MPTSGTSGYKKQGTERELLPQQQCEVVFSSSALIMVQLQLALSRSVQRLTQQTNVHAYKRLLGKIQIQSVSAVTVSVQNYCYIVCVVTKWLICSQVYQRPIQLQNCIWVLGFVHVIPKGTCLKGSTLYCVRSKWSIYIECKPLRNSLCIA